MARGIVDLPDGKYVMFTEGGGGQPSRIILQFESMDDMHKAAMCLTESIKRNSFDAEAAEAHIKRRVALDQYG